MDLQQIRKALKQPGKSRAGLAARLGVDVSQISRLLNGKRHLKVHELPLIQDYLWGVEAPSAANPNYQTNGLANGYGSMMGQPAASPQHQPAPKDNMAALELISELIDEAEKCDVDVANTILQALQNAIQAQRHPHTTGY